MSYFILPHTEIRSLNIATNSQQSTWNTETRLLDQKSRTHFSMFPHPPQQSNPTQPSTHSLAFIRPSRTGSSSTLSTFWAPFQRWGNRKKTSPISSQTTFLKTQTMLSTSDTVQRWRKSTLSPPMDPGAPCLSVAIAPCTALHWRSAFQWAACTGDASCLSDQRLD